MKKLTKEYDKNRNPLYTNKSFLMTINWKDLPNHHEWKQLVKECYKEHGYGWWFFMNMSQGTKRHISKRFKKGLTRK